MNWRLGRGFLERKRRLRKVRLNPPPPDAIGLETLCEFATPSGI
jgi:hypothetical protein